MGAIKLAAAAVATLLLVNTLPSLAAVPLYNQCGGIGYTGDTVCVAGGYCEKLSDTLSACFPIRATSTTRPIPTGTELPTQVTCASLPVIPTLTLNPRLPNPFRFADGRTVINKVDWVCRRMEVMEQLKRFELGTLPPKPTGLTASFAGGKLTINVSEGGNAISFQVPISVPTAGGTGSAPYPAIIALGGTSIPTDGVALITYNNDDIAAQVGTQSRGQGKFYTLYGASHSAGALIAWTWGVSRIIDALETTTGHNIDTKRIGVTGCSSNARGALVAGAFDDRIALTIPQESGTGGAGCWRIAERLSANGSGADTANGLVSKNVWFSKGFETTYVNQINILPYDHHILAALVAPRGLLVLDNSGLQSLGPQSVWGCMLAANKVYQSLNATSSMGVSIVGNHPQCSLPSSQNNDVAAFIRRFLFQQQANTNIIRNDDPSNFGYNESLWVDSSLSPIVG